MVHDIYGSIQLQGNEIRLLELFPGKSSEQMRCRLFIVSLDDSPVYEALSYAWGSSTETRMLNVNGHENPVRRNLYSAIHHLRRRSEPRVLWIDALCIHQANVKEKNHQVSMMGNIYRGTKEVIVWLGEADGEKSKTQVENGSQSGASQGAADLRSFEWGSVKDVDVFFADEATFDQWPLVGAFVIVLLLASDIHFDDFPFFHKGLEGPYPPGAVFNPSLWPSDLWRKSTDALVSLLTRPYWDRVWIVQEVVLAPSAKIYHGQHIIPLHMLLIAQYHLSKHYHGCCSQWGINAHGSRWTAWTSILTDMHSLEYITHLKTVVAGKASGKPGYDLRVYDVVSGGLDKRKATDPRDYIYGLLGLVTNWLDHPIIPDYSSTIAEVYSRAALKMIKDENSLFLLTWNDRQRKVSLGLPSWVPDWSCHGRFCPNPYFWHLFDAANSKPTFAEVHGDSELVIRSISVDVISNTGPVRTWQWYPFQKLVTVIQQWRDMAELDQAPEDMYTILDDAFWRTLFGDVMDRKPRRRATLEDVELFRACWAWMQKMATDGGGGSEWATHRRPQELQAALRTFEDMTESRKFFVTKHGRMGTGLASIDSKDLGRNEIRTGDEIHVVLGCNVPLVLRPLNQQDASGSVHEIIHNLTSDHISSNSNDDIPRARNPARYTLVGTCYVHGIMDGEAMNEKNIETIHLC